MRDVSLRKLLGNSICIEWVLTVFDYLGEKVSKIFATLPIQVVILGGGIMGQEAILKPLRSTALKEALVSKVSQKTHD